MLKACIAFKMPACLWEACRVVCKPTAKWLQVVWEGLFVLLSQQTLVSMTALQTLVIQRCDRMAECFMPLAGSLLLAFSSCFVFRSVKVDSVSDVERILALWLLHQCHMYSTTITDILLQ